MENWEIYSTLNFKMLQFKFHIICIFVLYGFIQVNYGETQKNKTNVIVYFEEANCVNKDCCDDLKKLPGGAVLKKVNDFELQYTCELPDMMHLPARVFQEKHIHKIVIKDPHVTVDSDFLEGIGALKYFFVQQSSIKAIPNFKFVKDSIKVIRIQSSLLTSLAGGNLQNLTRLQQLLFSNNSIHSIDPDVFKGTVNVEYLDLSHNLLTFIPETILDPMKKLDNFDAGYNNLEHVNNTFSITRPYYIDLRSNNITDISSALQFNFEQDEKRKTLWIHKCRNDENDRLNFRSLFSIDTLDLENNSIKETSQSIFPCLNHFPFLNRPVLQIDYFNLRENNIKNLNFLLRYLIIKKLDVPMNQIEYLTNKDFDYTAGIADLNLSENKIKWIDTETFRPLRPYLQYLHMDRNLITSLNGSLKYLINLRRLSLFRNSIKFFAIDEFLGLEELTELYIQRNEIKNIGLLQQIHRLKSLVINDNDIESVRPDLVSETIRQMFLEGNPIKCNCLLDLFIRRIMANSVQTDIHTVCSKHVSAVSIQKKFNSQDVCTYGCTRYENGSYIFVDCNSKNLAVVPQFPENGFAGVEILVRYLLNTNAGFKDYVGFIDKIKYATFYIEDKILGISLENNSLESLDTAQLPPNLIRLYLSENKLRRLPDSILENQRNLKQVTLSGNPWKCDCDAIKFKKWLTSNKEKIKDIDNVRCGIIGNEDSSLNGRVIINLTDLELCPTDIALIVLAPSGVLTAIIFCLVSKILYTRYKLNVKVFLYSHGITFVREEDLDYNKKFDAFISFSDNDGEFVTNDIISVIEKRNPNIHLCFHIRDFIPGELITTNITRAVQNSKKTVLILSKNFLESEWCLLEAQTAHSQAMEDKVHRIIVIKVGDLPKEIDPLIKAYLVSTTYITWGESSFWNKLLYVLPSHVSGRGNVPDTIGDNETVV